MQIAGVNKTSTVDFPGVLSAVLFTPGCNYSCFYCHNRQLLEDAPRQDLREVLAFLQKRAGLLDGIVITGGEPTMQEDIADFIAYIKGLGYAVKLDTNGSNPQVVRELLDSGHVDYVALDYKVPFELYGEICGMPADGMRETLGLLLDSDIKWEARTTMIPQIRPEKLEEMASAVPVLPRYVLQQYNPQPGDMRYLKTLLPYTPSEIRKLAEAVRQWQPHVEALV